MSFAEKISSSLSNYTVNIFYFPFPVKTNATTAMMTTIAVPTPIQAQGASAGGVVVVGVVVEVVEVGGVVVVVVGVSVEVAVVVGVVVGGVVVGVVVGPDAIMNFLVEFHSVTSPLFSLLTLQ